MLHGHGVVGVVGCQMNCETERMEVRRGLSLVAPGVMASPKQKNALSLMAIAY